MTSMTGILQISSSETTGEVGGMTLHIREFSLYRAWRLGQIESRKTRFWLSWIYDKMINHSCLFI